MLQGSKQSVMIPIRSETFGLNAAVEGFSRCRGFECRPGRKSSLPSKTQVVELSETPATKFERFYRVEKERTPRKKDLWQRVFLLALTSGIIEEDIVIPGRSANCKDRSESILNSGSNGSASPRDFV